MTFPKTILFVFLLCLCALGGLAQVKKSLVSKAHESLQLLNGKTKNICPLVAESKYPYHGIGFKAGDPFVLTYKFYKSKKWAFVFDVGKTASGLYSKYYRSFFNKYSRQDTLKTDPISKQKSTVSYLSHSLKKDIVLEPKILRHWDLGKVSKGLAFYAGLGWQFRYTTLVYDYSYQTVSLSKDSRFGKFTKNRYTSGPVVVAGLEYSYFSIPISAFIETELFTDALLDPGYNRFQGGLGLRYIF